MKNIMYQSVVLFVALRYLRSKTINKFYKYIGWFFSISIMLSIASIIVILSVMNGFECELKKKLLYFIPHVIVTADKGCAHVQNIPNFLLNTIRNDIVYIKPLITSHVILQSVQNNVFGIMFGVNPEHFEPVFGYLSNRDSISRLIPGKYYVIIGSILAQKLLVGINDQIRLTVPSVNRVIFGNYFPSQRLFMVLDIYISNNEIDNYQIFINQDDAANLMCYPSQYVTGWRMWLREPFKLNKFDKLDIPKDWHWSDWSKTNGAIFQAIKIEKNVMFLLFMLIILMIGCNVISFLVLLITDKKKEIAILKSYGFTRVQVMMLFLIQGAYNSIVGTLFGTVLGVLLSKNLNQILNFFHIFSKALFFPIKIQYCQILMINWFVCVIIILNIFYPAWYISSLNPAQVLHYD